MVTFVCLCDVLLRQPLLCVQEGGAAVVVQPVMQLAEVPEYVRSEGKPASSRDEDWGVIKGEVGEDGTESLVKRKRTEVSYAEVLTDREYTRLLDRGATPEEFAAARARKLERKKQREDPAKKKFKLSSPDGESTIAAAAVEQTDGARDLAEATASVPSATAPPAPLQSRRVSRLTFTRSKKPALSLSLKSSTSTSTAAGPEQLPKRPPKRKMSLKLKSTSRRKVAIYTDRYLAPPLADGVTEVRSFTGRHFFRPK